MDKKDTIVISGFPGIGKTFYRENCGGSVMDSDSSKFSWLKEGVRHPDFPQNYMDHIYNCMGEVDTILVSSHKVVRDALVKNCIPFILVYPERSLKDEYLDRFRARGSNTGFVDLLDKNWDVWMDELDAQEECEKYLLLSGTFLSDLLAQVSLRAEG